MAEFLLANGADINIQNWERNSALHLAAYYERIKTLEFLIRQGANVNARNTFGTTPVMYAAKVGSVEALRFLRKGGASMNARDESGRTAFHYAASESPSVFSFLFYENQDPYQKDYDGDSAVMLVIDSLKSHPAFLSLLCNLDIDYGRCSELIALFPVMSKEKLRLLLRRFPERLVSSGIRRVWKGRVRGSILNQAVRRGRDNLLEMLVKAGASIECEEGEDCSPLLAACSYGREDAMKYLTRTGASMFGAKDGKVCSALQAAKPFAQMVQWLLVGRHTEQKKLTAAETSRYQSKIYDWSGPRTAEVIIKDFYELTAGAPSRRLAEELSRLSRNLRGRAMVVRGLR
jgi:ankyrin repeat protein